LTSGNEPKRFAINLDDLDLAKFRRVGTKVMSILNNKMNNPVEAYLLLKILCYSIEDSEGFKLMPEDEERLRKLCLEPTKHNSQDKP
jgi:hypothetical protein